MIDTSIWIDYFHGKESALPLNDLIESNNLCINDIILTELLPSIEHKNEFELKELVLSVHKVRLDIDWNELRNMQIHNYKNGINDVGVPDLIIVQNILRNGLKVYANEKHFKMMSTIFGFELY
jgi:predicted nucleic acid-binding protein